METFTYNYNTFLQYISGLKIQKDKVLFSDVKEGDILYEIIEKTEDFMILERKIKWLKHEGKKTHFTLVPVEGLKDCVYCPYSNKAYTVSKQFNPIFVSKDGATRFLSSKIERDRSYLIDRLNSLGRKRLYLQYYLEGRVISTSTRRVRRPSVIQTTTPF